MDDHSKMAQDLQDYVRCRTEDDSLMQQYGACYEGLDSLCDDLFQAGKLIMVDEPYLQSSR